MSTAELYSKGARVWIPDPTHVWVGAEVKKFGKDELEVELEDGSTQLVKVTSDDKLPPLRNPDILIGENDLTSLSYLHEPAVLYNLQVRFCNQNAIYTYCGIVLVAINPYEELPIYGNDTIMAYRGQSMGDLDPHIFAVSEEAYTQMERESQNQSIIVSGESGAGKTVSAKYAMRYFATVGGSSTETQIEKKVLASNPIMEAIGNAKTTRNDNSSRFGKYIEIDFNTKYHIIGANMRTYLLEKSRVTFQAPEERNYHIFYQLCASADLEEMQDLQLGDQSYFNYTNQGDAPIISGVDDAKNFQETRNALCLLGFSDQQQMMMFRILSAVLHLGNITILKGGQAQDDPDSSFIPDSDPHLVTMCDLLGIECDQMNTWLCNRKIQSMREVITMPLPHTQALFARDALAKHIYSQLFEWIVTQINKSLASNKKVHKFIGVLDIYGFETFEINSFEQFCINYANEKLQQQFNMHVFKLEQEEYVREQIEWKFIDFYDNQPCIDLIESKLGILDLLDEECKMPKGTDETWCQKLFAQCKKWKHFEKPRLSNTAFIIHHFADKVKYEVFGFLQKNRDTVMEEHINILKASQFELVGELFEEEKTATKLKPVAKVRSAAPPIKGGQKQHKKTVGSQFRDSLCLLMSTLNATTPHYVRCIKPNDQKVAFLFEPHRAVQQLRACGVLETIRISAAGYPSRWAYQDFLNRYRVLTSSKDIRRSDLKITCQKILENLVREEDKFQFGKTKIFFRAGQVAYLEKLRSDKLRACAVMVQKHIRGWLWRHKYTKIKRTAILIQKYARGLLARRLTTFLRRTRAAIKIQKMVRMFVKRKQYLRTKRTVLGLQAHARGKWARIKFQKMRENASAIIIQKHVRGFLARRKYRKTLSSIVTCQSAVRRWFARKELKKLKIEAKSVEHVKKLNKGLENKIISLQQRIEELLREKKTLQITQVDTEEVMKQQEKVKQLEETVRAYDNRVAELVQTVAELRSENENLRNEKEDLCTEKDLLKLEKDEIVEHLNKDNIKLKEDLDKLNEAIKAKEKGAIEVLENEKRLLLEEFSAERAAYQKLLKENARLEQRFENLQNEMSRIRGGHRRTPSNVSLGSVRSDATELASDAHDDDVGYGSIRSKDKENVHLKLEDVHWDDHSPVSKEESPDSETRLDSEDSGKDMVDVTLVLKLQQKLKALESEKNRLEKKLENLEAKEEDSPKEEKFLKDAIRLQDLEMENSKLKNEITKLRESLAKEDPSNKAQDLLDQFEAMQEELERRREECIQLRTILADRNLPPQLANRTELINEDGELLMAFETQKVLIRQLEAEIQAEKSNAEKMEKELRHELQKLQEDNERQQKLLSQNLKKTPQAQTEAILQHEINRLTGENVDLREKIDVLSDQIKKYKKQLKLYAKKVKDTGVTSKRSSVILGLQGDVTLELEPKEKPNDMPLVKHKEVSYLGMFEYKKEDENIIIKNLIYDLKPKVAVNLLPGLPAYILFMCIRHTDYINDDEKVRNLLNNTIQGIKRVIKKRHDELDYTILWLANTCRLLHNLKQYSGDKVFQAENTPKQNEQCLRNFDLSEYRQLLSDVAVWIYQAIIKLLEEKVQPYIVPAILEHEAIPGISGNKPSGMRGRSSSVAREVDAPIDPQAALDGLLRELGAFFKVLSIHGVDPEIITQVYKQLFYFICAGALNNLLLRKDMCHWTKGMQIRYNLSHLEQWCRDLRIQHTEVIETLQPIVQASQLLQARKTDEDVQNICDMCDKLTTSQIVKILNLYTPADEYEERVPVSFIRKMQACLQKRDEIAQGGSAITVAGPSTLLMDTKYAFPIRFPFNPSNIQLEDIVLPDCLDLHHVLRKV
ncbi:unconventional myosin-Va-like isoform X3 [Argiope bruennichi]|uniref:Unconventional myosin-Va like protein n=1 Tax=Argiope bruennichi TaxID=94029 RepID=A0A8T0FD55_ARGBR|nr:unconventional myosin-Va-like isoform X3 [Argiope bruennichi]KAF8788252.1 Unconventional myosin-Va like protein [Argiope bruennichi]